ncbi:HGxxPAAW family protein [Saxibacter everestensis]|uniref:HGxxPAAW family protein n=1 Tax=Saxibacter everestensis TaxID=2909229 RepID=A0ABY8QXZ6_9MICO|nr:HGxxPAAW family protein [Brevibacteriaceae bacterium ZFBP1038]
MSTPTADMPENAKYRLTEEQVAAAVPESLGHGHSIAGWTTVLIMLGGCLISAAAFFLASVTVFWIGMAVAVVGLIVGWILRRVGFGVGGSRTSARH